MAFTTFLATGWTAPITAPASSPSCMSSTASLSPVRSPMAGKEPSNWFEVQDWNYEMWFSVVDALKRINDLIDAEVIRNGEFKKVELIEIEPETPAGYFQYFVERNAVYDRAFETSEKVFASLGL